MLRIYQIVGFLGSGARLSKCGEEPLPSLPSKSLHEAPLQAGPLLSALLLVRYPTQRGSNAAPQRPALFTFL